MGVDSGGSRNFERGVGGNNVSAASSFIANEPNELYAFYEGKGDLLKTLRG